ncbi:MAG: hypothetical protein A3D74_02075 [Candidatus Levybacteria bacterium RIFCSPHIGHO2_02_FULL_37_13]|nr:MAG: hypothetical protein A3D74_02075 [Candidatus Levybacteria bacterium RIFCSPHIGHO2_02_FULL_37_13]
MRILQYKKHSKGELINKLRLVTLLHSSNTPNPIYVFKDADIDLGYIPVESIVPSQFYYLKGSLSKVEEIEKAFKEHGVELFNLNGFINYTSNENSINYNLLPVIIEYQKEKDGSINPIILDGIHRVIMARNQKRGKIQVVKISNVSKDFPYPGYVNSRGWEEVLPVQFPPEQKDKRNWRFSITEVNKYYRDLNSVFENLGGQRK